jgi:Protein of unknown function (DUF3011)
MPNRSLPRLVAVALLPLALLPAAAHARYTISCSSSNYRYQYCGANTDGYARLVSQRSKAACIRGRTWGSDNGGVWVNNGCSGEFEVGGGGRSNDNAGAAVAAGVGLAILGAIIANQDQDNDYGPPPSYPYPQPYPQPPSYSYGSSVPGWAIGTFRGTNAQGQQQTITINPDGGVTLRYRNGAVERGYFNGGVANLPSGAVGIDPSGSGILVNGIYFSR